MSVMTGKRENRRPEELQTGQAHGKKELIGNRQTHSFRKGKSRLTNLITCYDEATTSVNMDRVTNIVFLGLCKVLETAPHLHPCLQDGETWI